MNADESTGVPPLIVRCRAAVAFLAPRVVLPPRPRRVTVVNSSLVVVVDDPDAFAALSSLLFSASLYTALSESKCRQVRECVALRPSAAAGDRFVTQR